VTVSIEQENIERGVAYLDSIDLEWRSRVDVDTLDMTQEQSDVLAQVTGMSFYDAVAAATLSSGEHWSDGLRRWAIEHGFSLPYISDEDEARQAWHDFTEAWRQEVSRG
jgi:hypothetical protein